MDNYSDNCSACSATAGTIGYSTGPTKETKVLVRCRASKGRGVSEKGLLRSITGGSGIV